MVADTLRIGADSDIGGQPRSVLAERKDGILLALGALEAALASFEFPTFIADRHGTVLHANAVGYRLLERESAAVKDSVVQMETRGLVTIPWEVVALPK